MVQFGIVTKIYKGVLLRISRFKMTVDTAFLIEPVIMSIFLICITHRNTLKILTSVDVLAIENRVKVIQSTSE